MITILNAFTLLINTKKSFKSLIKQFLLYTSLREMLLYFVTIC